MALTRGDVNATLKDLTLIAEQTLAQTRPSLVPKICHMAPEDGSYTKVPVPANLPFPSALEAEVQSHGKLVNVVQQYDQKTYELTVDIDSDHIQEARAYDYSSLVEEAAISSVIFPDYLTSLAVVAGSANNGYDGVSFYGANHIFGKAGTNTFTNTAGNSGQAVTNIADDLSTAIAKIRGFKDNQGRLLNQLMDQGKSQFVCQFPLAMEQNFRRVLNASMIPVTVPVTTSGTTAVAADNVLQGVAEPFPDGYLTGNSWYLHFTGMPQRPFVFFERYAPRVEVLGIGSEHQINTNTVRISIKRRFVLGYHRFDRTFKII